MFEVIPMCHGRNHRYRIKLRYTTKEGERKTHDLVVHAKGVAEAIAKADGWIILNAPGAKDVGFDTFHTGYSNLRSAVSHGAILPYGTQLSEEDSDLAHHIDNGEG